MQIRDIRRSVSLYNFKCSKKPVEDNQNGTVSIKVKGGSKESIFSFKRVTPIWLRSIWSLTLIDVLHCGVRNTFQQLFNLYLLQNIATRYIIFYLPVESVYSHVCCLKWSWRDIWTADTTRNNPDTELTYQCIIIRKSYEIYTEHLVPDYLPHVSHITVLLVGSWVGYNMGRNVNRHFIQIINIKSWSYLRTRLV